MNKNWSNNPRVGCQAPKDMVEVIEIEVDLTKELEEEFEDDIEHEQVFDLLHH
jgi:hypothetical protein